MQTDPFLLSNRIHSLKHLRSTTLGSKDIEIRNVSHSLLHSVSRKNAKFSRNKKGENFTKNNAKKYCENFFPKNGNYAYKTKISRKMQNF